MILSRVTTERCRRLRARCRREVLLMRSEFAERSRTQKFARFLAIPSCSLY